MCISNRNTAELSGNAGLLPHQKGNEGGGGNPPYPHGPVWRD